MAGEAIGRYFFGGPLWTKGEGWHRRVVGFSQFSNSNRDFQDNVDPYSDDSTAIDINTGPLPPAPLVSTPVPMDKPLDALVG